jgi:hypothetical protein
MLIYGFILSDRENIFVFLGKRTEQNGGVCTLSCDKSNELYGSMK